MQMKCKFAVKQAQRKFEQYVARSIKGRNKKKLKSKKLAKVAQHIKREQMSMEHAKKAEDWQEI